MQLHTIKANKKKARKRVGRGGSHGTYATRGNKGQKARSGGVSKAHSAIVGRRSQFKRLPILRGFKSPYADKFPVNLTLLEKIFKDGEVVNKAILIKKGLMNKSSKQGVKVLGVGEIKKKLIIEGCAVSESAKVKIEKAGGKINF